MVRNRIFYLVALVAALVFHSFYTMWFSWYFLVLLLCLPWFSLLFSLPAMLKLQVRTNAPKVLARRSNGKIQLCTASALPLPGCKMTLVLTNTLTGCQRRQKVCLTQARFFTASLPAEHCGNVLCTGEKIRVYDYLGLFCLPRPKVQLAQSTILPLPSPPARKPALKLALPAAYRVRPGGGIAETYELREYRSGDHLQMVHWKLSSKLDNLVVREAMEPVSDPVLLTFDLAGTPGEIDSVLDQLSWLSRWLLSKELPHSVLWIDGASAEVQTACVATEAEREALLRRLLCRTAAPSDRSIGGVAFRSSWRYHIIPRKEAQS